MTIRPCALLTVSALLCLPALAQDWNNLGGNAARNGFAYPLGPRTPAVAWTNSADPSVISWAPFVEDGRVFTIAALEGSLKESVAVEQGMMLQNLNRTSSQR